MGTQKLLFYINTILWGNEKKVIINFQDNKIDFTHQYVYKFTFAKVESMYEP